MSNVPSLYEWFVSTVSVDSMLNTLGLGVLALLFATDRIMTKGQHTRRVADIVTGFEERFADSGKAHEGLLAEIRDRYAEMRDSRDYWRDAYNEEKSRGDSATQALVETTDIAKVAAHALSSLNEATKEAHGG
jgi:hypothetical protein